MHSLKLISFISFLTLVGCAQTVRKPSVTSNLEYVKDYRTGLCFVNNPLYDTHGKTHVLTNVPCNDEVENLVNP